MTFGFLQFLTTGINRCQHNILKNGFVVEKIKMLEYHAHLSSMDIDIDLHICNIHPVEDNLSRCRVFHTVQAAEKCTLTGT